VEYQESFGVEEVIARAQSRLGEVRYNLALNNCEHFATWCKTGHHVSGQVAKVKEVALKYARVSKVKVSVWLCEGNDKQVIALRHIMQDVCNDVQDMVH
jgi:hypothetical protein